MSRVPVTEIFLRNSVPPTLRRNLEVFLYKRGTAEKAPIFTAESGGEERAQPLITDEQGRVKTNLGGTPWVAVGKYTFKGAEGTGVELQWEGAPGAEGGGGGGGEPTGPAGGDLTGEYPNPTVGSEKISEGKLGALSVSTAKLAASAVTAAKIGAEAIEAAAIKTGAVTNAKLAVNAVSPTKIEAEAVETAKIKLLNITTALLASEAVETGKIKLLAITEGLLASEAVAEGKIKNLAVSTGKIAASAVTAAKLGSEAVETAAIKAANVTEAKLGAEAVSTAKIKLLNVTAATLAAEAVEEGKIKNLAVVEGKLATAVQTKLKGQNRESRTFAVPAGTEVKAETIGQFWEYLASGETKKLVAMKYSIASGTSFKFSIKQNGTAVTGFKEKTAEVTAAEVTGEISVAAADLFALVGETATGTPKGLTVTLVFENNR